MATVYLARDLKHHREVALKVLRPELGAMLGDERFLREVATTARLAHPCILPLFDSGSESGLCWYAMPYFAGKTLADRLKDQGALPVPEAVALFRDVASALDYAHRQGVIHRDLKPANVLLQDGRAVLADFGIALPIDPRTERLTDTGLSIGTPEYMSPEQAFGERDLDARSDVYALGCVLYEMLAGQPPFTGKTPQAIARRRLTEPAPPITSREVPASLETALARALARKPDERFGSVAEFVEAIELPGPISQPARWVTPRLVATLALLVIAAVVALRAHGRPAQHFDPNVVAVLPARINAPGHSLDYLREGILDLAAVRLTGEGGPRSADPRATLATLRNLGTDDGAMVAARLGAGKLLDESIVSDGQHLTLSATLSSFPEGVRHPPVSVEGPEDSIGVLVDRLMIKVLALQAGEHASVLRQVTSLPAWRAYLQGKSLYRAGRYTESVGAFEAALQADTAFTLAALDELPAMVRAGVDAGARSMQVFRNLSRLSADDSAYFFATEGTRYPRPSNVQDQLAALEALVRRLPDRADAWFELGDMQLHAGPTVDMDSSLDYAARSLQRALALDSSFALPMDHLLFVAFARRDTAAIRQLRRMYTERDSLGDRAAFILWRSAVALGDSAEVRRQRARFGEIRLLPLGMLINLIQNDGVGVGDAELADSILIAKSATNEERAGARLVHGVLRLNLGRSTSNPVSLFSAPIDNALFSDGDTIPAGVIARQLRAAGPLRNKIPSYDDWIDRWELACWDLAHGQPETARAVIPELMTHLPREIRNGDLPGDSALAPGILEAWIAVETGAANARMLVDRVDSIAATGAVTELDLSAVLLLGDFYSRLGAPLRALRALRRTQRYLQNVYSRATILLARARVAAKAGARDEAIDAYEAYLRLRSNPDPRLIPQRDSARTELAGLKTVASR